MRFTRIMMSLLLVCAIAGSGCSSKGVIAPDKDKFKAVDTSSSEKVKTEVITAPQQPGK